MAKKDAVSKRLAREIAFVELLKNVPPFFTLEELPAPDELPAPELPAPPALEELPALLQLGGPWHEGLGSYGRGASEKPILDAFKAFGLDHRSLSDWRALVFHLANVLFPTPGPPGAPRKWTDERLCKLLADVAPYKRKHPKASDTAICNWLSKKWSKKTGTLRRKLPNARNPRHNTELARMVAIFQRRLDPDLNVAVSWVIAHADKLWAS